MNEDRSARYHRLRRRAAVLSTGLGGVWLLVLAVTPFGLAVARAAEATATGLPPLLHSALSVAVFVALATAGYELLTFPLAYYSGFRLERAYGLSAESFRTWLGDQAKGVALGLALAIAAGLAVTAARSVSPRWWWGLAALSFSGAIVVLVGVAPTLLMPLFYHFAPLAREDLRQRLVTLSDRAGVRVLGTFEWALGEKTTRANAALVGLGRTRRIILSDTLLNGYSDDEIEVILAHELAHHVHHDLWSAVGIDAATIAAGLGTASRLATGDGIVVLARIALVSGIVSLLVLPISNWWSRRNERRADRYALELTRRPGAFISAIRRLGAQNLAEDRPSRVVRWLFHSHPTIDERVAAARAFDVD